ncbi:MAG: helix-turn-helix transcriptional regulator [Bacteroidaceae bacterium]|nr:helix-turn-helix transcriptional regulator [Bacteroidaceae bacterium]
MKAIEVVKANKSYTPSKWKEEATWRRDNWSWLKYSYQIAIKMRAKMKELGMTQKELAEKLGCTQQYVSLLLKGNENLTLDTISSIEKALDIAIIGNLIEEEKEYMINMTDNHYVCENPIPEYGSLDTKTK